jgi:hypothetical protein
MGPDKVGQISQLEIENLVHEGRRFVTKLDFIGVQRGGQIPRCVGFVSPKLKG